MGDSRSRQNAKFFRPQQTVRTADSGTTGSTPSPVCGCKSPDFVSRQRSSRCNHRKIIQFLPACRRKSLIKKFFVLERITFRSCFKKRGLRTVAAILAAVTRFSVNNRTQLIRRCKVFLHLKSKIGQFVERGMRCNKRLFPGKRFSVRQFFQIQLKITKTHFENRIWPL